MKTILSVLALSCCMVVSAKAQGYQPQYPYDPYNPAPQQQQSYQTYSSTGSSYGSSNSLLGYQSLEVRYVYNDFKGDDRLEGDSGFGVDLKLELMKPLYLRFGLDRITSKTPEAEDLDLTTFSVAGGAFIPIGNRFHIFGEVGARYDYVSEELENISTDDFYLYVRPGVRFAVTDKLELALSLLFTNTDNLNERVIELNAYYAMLSWLDVSAGIDFGDEVNSFHLGGRWRW